MISYPDYKTKYLNESNIGNTPENVGQCNGLVQEYFAENGLPHIVGNAKDIYNAASNDLFEKLPPNAQVKQGDIFCCGKPWGLNPNYNPHDPKSVQYFGHVGFVDQPMQGQSFMGMEQNGTYLPPHKVQLVFHQQRNGFIGFLRIKEGVMEPEFNPGDRVNINIRLYGRDLGLHSDAVGMKYKAAVEHILQSPEYIHEHTFNPGDAVNANAALNRSDAQSQLGKVWKDVDYTYLFPNIQNK